MVTVHKMDINLVTMSNWYDYGGADVIETMAVQNNVEFSVIK